MALARSRLIDPGAPSADALIAALPTALLVLDGEGCITSVNAAAEMLLNASAAHLLHKPLGIVLRIPQACHAGLREESVFAAYDCELETARGIRLRADLHALTASGTSRLAIGYVTQRHCSPIDGATV